MYRIRPNHCALAFFAGIIFISHTARAVEIKPSASLALQYTDNARKTSDNEASDVLMITSIGAGIDAGSGPFQLKADTSLKHTNYIHDSFGDQQYFNLKASAGWEMLKERLDWKLQNFFTQQSIDSLNPNTPDNIQDSNVFTFGPNIYYRISGLQSLTISPQYRKFSYEIQNTDNQQNALDARWNYQLFRTVSIGVRGGTNKVDYDDPQNIDNTFTNIHLTLSAKRADYSYSADLGTTRVQPDDGNNVHGVTGNLRWLFNITGASSLRAYLASDLTDASNNLLNSSINPDDGDFSNEQISPEIMRNSVFRLAYQMGDAPLSSSLWLELREQDYELALLDREVQATGIEFNYPLTATLAAGINAGYSRTELTDTLRKDNQRSLGGIINVRFSRLLLGTVNLKYHDTNSSLDVMNYSEMTVYVGLVYGYNL